MWFSTDFTVGVANRPPIKVYSLENFRPISLKLFIGLKKLQLVETISEVVFLMLCLPRYLHFHKIFCKYWNQGMRLYDLLVSLLEIWRCYEKAWKTNLFLTKLIYLSIHFLTTSYHQKGDEHVNCYYIYFCGQKAFHLLATNSLLGAIRY